MGLLDFGKRKKKPEFSNVFKGDLAQYHAEKTVEDSERINSSVQPVVLNPVLNEDAADSEVFMTFFKHSVKYWSCPECGTHNNSNMSGCVVCGLENGRGGK